MALDPVAEANPGAFWPVIEIEPDEYVGLIEHSPSCAVVASMTGKFETRFVS